MPPLPAPRPRAGLIPHPFAARPPRCPPPRHGPRQSAREGAILCTGQAGGHQRCGAGFPLVPGACPFKLSLSFSGPFPWAPWPVWRLFLFLIPLVMCSWGRTGVSALFRPCARGERTNSPFEHRSSCVSSCAPSPQLPAAAKVTKFHALRAPGISVHDYLERCVCVSVRARLCVSVCVFVCACFCACALLCVCACVCTCTCGTSQVCPPPVVCVRVCAPAASTSTRGAVRSASCWRWCTSTASSSGPASPCAHSTSTGSPSPGPRRLHTHSRTLPPSVCVLVFVCECVCVCVCV